MSERIGRRGALTMLVAMTLATAFGLLAWGPVPIGISAHVYADTREWLGIPNAENVLSNLPFALIGAWGLWWQARAPAGGTRLAWSCFSAAVLCTAFGSALYHWAPGNGALVFDRLPIAWACAALLCAFLAERVDARWAGVPALVVALLVASASVAWWWLGERAAKAICGRICSSSSCRWCWCRARSGSGCRG